MNNELAKELTLAEGKSQYDTQCKRVLADRTILSWILKHTTAEFRDMTIRQIQACIEGEPEISEIRVEPGATNHSRITGDANEDKVPDEGAVYFDIRFSARVPVTGMLPRKRVKLIINIEAQQSFYPGYAIVTRGIYYGARLISSQMGTEFMAGQYNDIKKVYSIWICMNSPKYIGNAISGFSIQKNDLIPGIPDDPKSYDKLTVILICLNRNTTEKSELTMMLNTLLSPELPAARKIQNLKNKFQIDMEVHIGKELNQMCNLSDYVEELGIEKGRLLTFIEIVQKQNRKNAQPDEIADFLGEDPALIRSIYLLVQEAPDSSSKEILDKMGKSVLTF